MSGMFSRERGQIRLGFSAAVIGALSYGINIPFARLAQDGGITAAQLSFFRSSGLALVLLILAVMLGQKILPPRGSRAGIVLVGFINGVIALTYLASVSYIPVALAVVIFYTYPLIVIVADAIIKQQMPTMLRCCVFVAAFAGIVIAVGPQFEQASVTGIMLAGIASVACAALYLIAARTRTETLGAMVLSQIVIVPMSACTMIWLANSFDPSVMASAPLAAFCANIGYSIGFLSIMFAATRIGSTNLSLAFLIEPVAGIVSAALVLGQHPGALQWCGVAIILSALAVDAIASGRLARGGMR